MSDPNGHEAIFGFLQEPNELLNPVVRQIELQARAGVVLQAAAERMLDIQTDPNTSQRDAAEAAWIGKKIADLNELSLSYKTPLVGPESNDGVTPEKKQYDREAFMSAQHSRLAKLDFDKLAPEEMELAFTLASELTNLYSEYGGKFEDFNIIPTDDGGLSAIAYTAQAGIVLGSWNDIKKLRGEGKTTIGDGVDSLAYTTANAYLAISRAQCKLGQSLDKRKEGNYYGGPGKLFLTGCTRRFAMAFGNANTDNAGITLFVGPPSVTEDLINPNIKSKRSYVRPIVPIEVRQTVTAA